MAPGFARCLCCAALIGAWPVAHATGGETRATLTVDNLRFSVEDTDPADGVAAGFWYADRPDAAFQSAGLFAGSQLVEVARPVADPFTPLSLQVGVPGGASSIDVLADGVAVAASLWSPGMESAARVDLETWDPSSPAPVYGLVLAPHTRFIVSADVAMTLLADNPWPGALNSVATASWGMNAHIEAPGHVDGWFGGWQPAFSEVRATDHPVSYSYASTVNLYLVNSFDVPADVSLRLIAQAWTFNAIPVPEPATGALMLAGLAALAVMGRLRGRPGVP